MFEKIWGGFLKAIILAAGQGKRMPKYTKNLPKGMLPFRGRPLIEWQVNTLRASGIKDIAVVTGYRREAFTQSNIRFYHNPAYADTNMIETLFCAGRELRGDVLVSYSDILYTKTLVRNIKRVEGSIVVAVDSAWRDYWRMRYGTTEYDLETLTIKGGQIVELGRAVNTSADIDCRYIGMIKFSDDSWEEVFRLYEEKKNRNERWKTSQCDFRKGYMTDLLNELIQRKVPVIPCITAYQWLEFDTESDYEKALEHDADGSLSMYFNHNDLGF